MEEGVMAEGTILSGISNLDEKQWVIGKLIARNGIEETYGAALYDGKMPIDYSLVVKIVPHTDGPLPVNFQFYLDNTDPMEIDIWKRRNKIETLGLPSRIGLGRHNFIDKNYQFIVMEPYGKDLWSFFLERGRKFQEHTVYKIALQILPVLKYIHSRGYVHGDIKGSNIAVDSATQNQIYLVNYHFASRYRISDSQLNSNEICKIYNQHTSRDSYVGVPTISQHLARHQGQSCNG